MLVMSEERYIPVSPGYIVLQDSDGVYYYVHRTFYEQAVILTDRYGESIETLQNLIGGNRDFVAIEKFVQYLPRPLTIMGYFLALLEEDIEDFNDIVGAMDVIATALDLRRLIKMPAAVRQTVTFGMSIQNEYQDNWDLFFNQCIPYEDFKRGVLSGAASAPASRRSASSYSSSDDDYEDDVEEDDEDEGEEDPWAALMADFNSGMQEDLAALDTKEKKEPEVVEEAPAPQTTSQGGSGFSAIQKAKARRSL